MNDRKCPTCRREIPVVKVIHHSFSNWKVDDPIKPSLVGIFARHIGLMLVVYTLIALGVALYHG